MIYIIALLSGAIFGLSCMIPWLMPLAFVAEAPFIAILIKKCEAKIRPRKAYLLGFINAIGFYVVSWYWFICTYPLECSPQISQTPFAKFSPRSGNSLALGRNSLCPQGR
jgi:hypothetical protein